VRDAAARRDGLLDAVVAILSQLGRICCSRCRGALQPVSSDNLGVRNRDTLVSTNSTFFGLIVCDGSESFWHGLTIWIRPANGQTVYMMAPGNVFRWRNSRYDFQLGSQSIGASVNTRRHRPNSAFTVLKRYLR